MINELSKTIYINNLLDIYGNLLSPGQRKMMTYYYQDNLSLSEIAENENVSRNAVHDSLKKAEASLIHYEEEIKAYQNKLKLDKTINELFEDKHLDEYAYKTLKGE